jgi:guanylate kinase
VRMTRPFPIVVSGPSGVGKTTVVDACLRRDPMLRASVSATTRPPREGEIEGESYFFVSEDDFVALKKGKLIEWAVVHGHQYGTPRAFVDGELARGKDVVLNIDVQGGAAVKKAFPHAVLIFILPPTFETLEKRIRMRGTDGPKEIEKRLANARREMEFAKDYGYILVNDKLEETVGAIEAIVQAERHRRIRYDADFTEKFIKGK